MSRAFGWQRDLPDSRDYTAASRIVQEMLARLAPQSAKSLPSRVDLREYFPEPYDQLAIRSSASQACVALVEYFEILCHGNFVSLSRLFNYQTTCRLLDEQCHGCTDLRTALKALVRFGLPPDKYWPYEEERLPSDPRPQLYSFAESYRTVVYFRLDSPNGSGAQTLQRVKDLLNGNMPVAFGVCFPSSPVINGDLLYRPDLDGPIGGQTVVAVGYDDDYLSATRGALLVRNSWGTGWGEKGYAWLPYSFVIDQLAADFWTILREDWVDSGELFRPQFADSAREQVIEPYSQRRKRERDRHPK